LSVVSCDKIRVHLLDKIAPSDEQVFFFFKRINFGSDDLCATFQSEDISDKWFFFAMNFDNVCNLNYWIAFRSWKFSFVRGTFNIKAQNSQRCDCRVMLQRNTLDIGEILHINFELARALFRLLASELVFSRWNLDPLHSENIVIDHKPERKWHV